MGKRTNTAVWLENQHRWQIKVQKDSVRRTFTSSRPGRNGQKEANAKADAWLDDNIGSDNARVSELYVNYLEALKLRYSEAGWEKEDYFYRCHVGPAIGHKKWKQINELDLQRIIDKAYHDGRSKKTLKGLRSFIGSFLRYCRKAGATKLEHHDLTIPKNAPEGKRKILQPSALVILLNSNKTTWRGVERVDENIYAYRFAVLTGLRPGELRNLRWCDIQGSKINVTGAINVKHQHTTGKNKNAVRTFKMTPLAQQILHEHKVSLSVQPRPQDPVFLLPLYATFYKQWQRYCESNHIPPISLYEMRHSFVSIAKRLEEGMVKPLVGHAEDMDTFGIYGHEMDGDADLVAEELDTVFRKVIEYGEGQIRAAAAEK